MANFQTTLIIGLGGVGSRVVEGIYRKFNSSKPSEEDRRNVAFLCFDTDEADINKRRRVMPFGSVIKTSSDSSVTVGDYIEKIQDNTSVNDWFDTRSREVLNMTLNEGAAQLRMASRLAYMSSIQDEKMSAINNTIRALLAVDPERHPGNNIRINIISSLAGGTGAGSFLQMAYYVKQAMRNENVDAPKITGFFLLANVLTHDSGIGLSDAQKENCRSNTYACIKELAAFSNSDRDGSIRPIQFEYMHGQRKTALPAMNPYDNCFIIDYTGDRGGNLRMERRYEEQATQFVYLNAFSPIGDTHRSLAINNIRQLVEADGSKRYAAIGVSRLVYPVDDLFDYFARQQMVDNLNGTWLRIDKEFDRAYAEYNKKIAEGIPAEEPDKGRFFMENVERLAKTGSGREGTEFRQIYNSTQVLDKELASTGSKAKVYVEAVKKYVKSLVENDSTLTAALENCANGLQNFLEEDDEVNDRNTIRSHEEELDTYWKKTKRFIDNTKRGTVRQCLAVDLDNEGYVAKDAKAASHCLNTYILEREKEMHPIAARYFLYDVRNNIKAKLESLKKTNEELLASIEGYKDSFDDLDTEDIKEGPEDMLKRSKGFKRVIEWFGRKSSIQEAKEDYTNRSQSQYTNIKTYSNDALLEAVLSGLLPQVNQLIDESEQFFSRLNYTIDKLQSSVRGLLKKHDGSDDPSVQYVLSSQKIKEDIYNAVVLEHCSPFFPPQMSASLYRSMYQNAMQEFEKQGPATKRKKDPQLELKRRIEADRKVIDDCIKQLNQLMRKGEGENALISAYAKMNVLEALKEEGERETESIDMAVVFPYMKRKFHAFRDRAQIWGANSLDNDTRFINAWGYNPICAVGNDFDDMPNADRVLTEAQANELFGGQDVDTNPTNAATRLASEFFTPYEIVRANAVTLLSIDRNFRDLYIHNESNLSDERIGEYYDAYCNVIKKMKQPGSKTYSPHLDKHWHLPAYMPNIGTTMTYELTRFFKALIYGLLLDRVRTVSDGGTYYWKYAGNTIRWITDEDGKRVVVGNSRGGALNSLLENGLACNPDIVDEILQACATEWNEAAIQWADTEYTDADELQKMQDNVMVRRILNFTFDSFSFSDKSKGQNWFSLLTANKQSLLYRLVNDDKYRFDDMLFNDTIERLLHVFGKSHNTISLVQTVFATIADDGMREEAMARLDANKTKLLP